MNLPSIDAYTASREASDLAGLDLDIDRIVPPLAYQPIPGEETVSPDGVRMFVERVTEHECCICVAGLTIDSSQGARAGRNTCFIYRFVRFP